MIASLAPFLADVSLKPLLTSLLYVVIVLAILACVIWAIEQFIAPIPNVIKAVVAIIALIVCVLYFLP